MDSLLGHDGDRNHRPRLHACAVVTVPPDLLFLGQISVGPLYRLERHHCDELALERLRCHV